MSPAIIVEEAFSAAVSGPTVTSPLPFSCSARHCSWPFLSLYAVHPPDAWTSRRRQRPAAAGPVLRAQWRTQASQLVCCSRSR
jgi:hypothetical protein